MSKPIFDVLTGKTPPFLPIWIMRQAGRYLPQYQKIRERYDFLTMCKTPEVAAEVTLQPLELFDLDAAIIFSDILVVCEAMGMKLQFVEDKGPVFPSPLRSTTDITSLNASNIGEELQYVYNALEIVATGLSARKTLIGFAGAPFTLACYMVEGAASKNYIHIKKLMYNDQRSFGLLMAKLTTALTEHCQRQIRAGAEVIMLFDTFGAIAAPVDYRRYIFPYVEQFFCQLRTAFANTPLIYFVKNGANLFPFLQTLPINAIGVDWTVSLAEAAAKSDNRFVLQGNLDPALLFADTEIIAREAKRIIDEGKNTKGHIFNLGHGILPQTPVENVKFLVDYVHHSAE